mgnify:CR=1 FL=1
MLQLLKKKVKGDCFEKTRNFKKIFRKEWRCCYYWEQTCTVWREEYLR